MFGVSILFAIAPFAFGVIRIFEAGDYRMLWMALASFVGAVLVLVFARGRSYGRWMLPLIVLVITALFAAATGILLGATAGPGVWMVAFVFGLSWAAHYLFHALARKP